MESDYDDALRRALAYTDDVGLSDGTDRPTDSADDVIDDAIRHELATEARS